jgi:hypothetical protein
VGALGDIIKLREVPKAIVTNCAPKGGKIAGVITSVKGESGTQGQGNDLGYGKITMDWCSRGMGRKPYQPTALPNG